MKKNVIAALVLGSLLIAPALANAYYPSSATKTDVILTGLWSKLWTENTDYAINSINTLGLPTGNVDRVDPDYTFGVGLALDYHLDCMPYDVYMSYLTYKNTSSDNVTHSGHVGGILISDVWDVGYVDEANSSLLYRTDLINVNLGTLVQPFHGVTLHPFMGLAFLHLQNDQSASYIGGKDLDTDRAITNLTSSFNGFGPTIGTDIRYGFGCGFALVGTLSYSALVGDINGKYKTAPIFSDSDFPPSSVSFQDKSVLASNVQTELGISYDLQSSHMVNSGTVEVGYQVNKTFNATERLGFPDDCCGFATNKSSQSSGFSGLFARLIFAV